MQIVGIIASTIGLLFCSVFMWLCHSDESKFNKFASWFGPMLIGFIICLIWSDLWNG